MHICVLDSYTLTISSLNSNNMDAPLDQHDSQNSKALKDFLEVACLEVPPLQLAEISKHYILVMK